MAVAAAVTAAATATCRGLMRLFQLVQLLLHGGVLLLQLDKRVLIRGPRFQCIGSGGGRLPSVSG
jgi:hypothetical protein|eukprot:SAG25_NODE_2408_length_1635_cov_0.873698_2_plen_65_part_00